MKPKGQEVKRYKEIVLNSCYGGFSLSHQACMYYAKLKGITLYPFISNYKLGDKGDTFEPYKNQKNSFIIHYSIKPLKNGKYDKDSYWSQMNIERDDPDLIKTVKKLKDKAAGEYAKLKIVRIPDDIKYLIEEYDGMEHIAEEHKTWG